MGGDAITFNAYVDGLIKAFPDHENGFGHVLRGGFYLAGTAGPQLSARLYFFLCDRLAT
jgi:hypothetical protein